jgi:hypothetical protein
MLLLQKNQIPLDDSNRFKLLNLIKNKLGGFYET